MYTVLAGIHQRTGKRVTHMSKKTKVAAKPAAPTKTEQPAGAAGKTVQAAKVLYLQVKTGVKFRGARDKWYTVLQQYNGKPASDYLTACKENPPSLPKSGVAEAPQGWLSYFQRVGAVELVAAK